MSTSASNRIMSLDAFRGITIAGMVLVNNPGGSPVYGPLNHAEWHGLTPTDWIFPFFLFIVGVSIAISLRKPGARGRGAYLRILSRSAWIYLLGAAMSILPFFQFQPTDAPAWLKILTWLAFTASLFVLLMREYRWTVVFLAFGLGGIAAMHLAGFNVVPYDLSTLRIMGVLQRIALVYLVVAILFLHTTWKQQLGISAILLLGYWLLMSTISVPGCEITTIDDKACNLAAYLDRLILTENHIWRGGRVYDPEGLLSTLPAIVTCISGVLAGTWLSSRSAGTSPEAAPCLGMVSGMFAAGLAVLAAGYIWSYYLPLNKALWTSSYVLVTSGLALLTLALCYWLIDIQGYRKWAWPFIVFGVNALPLFVFSGIMARMLSAWRVPGAEGTPISLSRWSMQNVFLQVFQPTDASLAYAITFVLIWLLFMWLLYRKQIYLKV